MSLARASGWSKAHTKNPRRSRINEKRMSTRRSSGSCSLLLDAGTYPAIATHDPAMIEATRSHARQRGIAKDRFEFQMLYGIRRDLQAALVSRRPHHAALHPLRTRMVPVFHAPPGRAAG